MSKVRVKMNDGRIKEMDNYYAKALIHCRKAVLIDDYEKKVIHSSDYEKKGVDRDELLYLRAKYQEKFGKRAFHGWDAEELKNKIESND